MGGEPGGGSRRKLLEHLQDESPPAFVEHTGFLNRIYALPGIGRVDAAGQDPSMDANPKSHIAMQDLGHVLDIISDQGLQSAQACALYYDGDSTGLRPRYAGDTIAYACDLCTC